MLNQIVIVGRIKNIDKKDNECYVKISVPRPFKNEDGEYESDILDVMLKDKIADNLVEWCSVEDLVGVKGRLEQTNKGMIIVAEKVTFLSSKKEDK